MIDGKGIDPTTGLPDLSLLGDDHYWEVVRSETSTGLFYGAYAIRLVRKVVTKKFLRSDKITYNIVGESVIQRKKSFDELTDRTLFKLEKYISANRYKTTPEELFNSSKATDITTNSLYLTHNISTGELIEYNLSDELIQLCALNVYNEALKTKTKALDREIQTKANDKFLGTYPPNKLGSSDDNGS